METFQIIYGESFDFTKDDVINYLNALNQMLINDLVIFKIQYVPKICLKFSECFCPDKLI